MGFFTKAEKKRPVGTAPHCGSCGLASKCRSPKLPLQGDGGEGLLIVTEAPSEEDDRQGKLWSGDAGRLLRGELKRNGIHLDKDCWTIGALSCRQASTKDPSSDQLTHCLPLVVSAIKETKPRVVMALGRFGIHQTIRQLWRTVKSGERWVGHIIPSIDWNAWVCPTHHPGFIQNKMGEVDGVIWRRHIRAICDLQGRPYDEIPDYQSKVKVVYDPDQAARMVRKLMSRGVPLAFDYESDRLKPDETFSSIYSCAVSDGKRAVSYLWAGEAIEATKELLWSGTPMMAWNMKHEERWTRRMFGKGVRNWKDDGMLRTHVTDNRQGVTGLKFQAFVRLGVPPYDEDVESFLKSETSNSRNNIRKADPAKVLLYGGMDALLTAVLAQEAN